MTELIAGLEEDEEVANLAIHSRLLQLQYAWRVGMGRDEEARLAAEAEEIAMRREDLHSLALLRVATSVRPGLEHRAEEWLAAVRETVGLADRTGDRHLRVAIRSAGAYAFLTAGDFEGFERMLDEVLELAGEDGSVGAGIILGSPIAWGLMGKGMVRREQLEFDQAEELFERALQAAIEEDDPETASWVRSNQAGLMAMRGDAEAGLGAARRNVELTDKLGDVFSRTLALSNLAWIELNAGEVAAALETIEESERLYREAMGNGGEMAAWRAQLRSQVLREAGRAEEAVEAAEWSAATARERGMMWTYPVTMLALARALSAAGRDGAAEALAESERVARETGALALLLDIEAEQAQLESAAGRAP